MADVLDRAVRAVNEACAGLDVVAAYVFGSVARGTAHSGSDLDVGVLVGHPDPDERERVVATVARRLSAHGEVDVVALDDAPIRLVGRVLTEGRLACTGDDERRIEFEVASRRAYFDFEPFAAAIDRAYLARVARS